MAQPYPKYALAGDPTASLAWTAPITPNDSADLPDYIRAICIGGTAGTIAYHDWDGIARSTNTLPQGWHIIRMRRVLATGTTATDLTGGV